MAITETWLGSDVDDIVMSELVQNRYAIHHVPRKARKGGGVALIYNKSMRVTPIESDNNFAYFEHMECFVSTKNAKLRVCVVYRPPSVKNNGAISGFFEDWSQYLSTHVVAAEELLITGDMNFHLDLPDDLHAKKFLNTLSEHGLTQHVTGPTHVRGHDNQR